MTLAQDLQYVVELARGAGQVVLDHYGKVDRLTKTHATTTDEAVTEADRATQRFIVAGLRKRFPTDGLVGEESDTGESITFQVPDPDGRVWVIDPIDGTNNFIGGMGHFAVCIGLLQRGMPVLGVVYDVTRDHMYAGATGEGAWLGTRQLFVNPEPLSPASLLMLSSNLLTKHGRVPSWSVRWLSQTEWKVRIFGSAALEAVQVGAGVAHGAVTTNGKLWDAAAPAAIVLAAGGRFVDPTGGNDVFPFDLRSYKGTKVPFLATTPAAQDTLLRELRENP